MSDYKIVRGELSGSAILVFPDGYVYLNHRGATETRSGCVGELRIRENGLGSAPPYLEELTDEELAIVTKFVLLHG